MKFVRLTEYGTSARVIHINPEYVVAVMPVGEDRCQVVTAATGVSGGFSPILAGSAQDIAVKIQNAS